MKKVPSSRVLLLEQLESRCMLAAGVLAQSFDQHGRHPPEEHNAVERSQAVDRQGRSESQRPKSDGPKSDGPKSDGPDHRSINRQRSSPRHGAITPNPGQANVGNVVQTNPTLILIEPRGPSTAPKESNLSSRIPDTISNILNMSTPNAVSARSAKQQTESATRSSKDADADPDVTADAVFASSQDAFGEQARNAASSFSTFQKRVVEAPQIETSEGTVGEMIETLPLLRRHLYPPAESETDQQWQIERQSIERIREVTRTSDSAPAEDTDRITDATIASWFNGQTGLIELEAAGKLQLPVDPSSSMVDVVLDATVGLHRSVELIAVATPESDAIPNDVRAAILAAIAAEQPSPIADAITVPAQARLGGVAYCATAVVAGTVAATARRHKKAKLESTLR